MNAIPVSVLIDICQSIQEDKSAFAKAQNLMVPVSPDFIGILNEVILCIEDSDVRTWALREIQGVSRE